ncbi:nucleoside-diphosphate kinase [Vibrio splendidus]|nr:nucleoside-diphosphate kinase [Vibrio splendidus]MCC4880757.1 nucleoside-diphosphate kinase [Vibrio splendidus]
MLLTKTFGFVKPNATKDRLEDLILADIQAAGLTILSTTRGTLSREAAETFYAEHKERPFFGELVDFMVSGEVIGFVLEGQDAVITYRTLMGATDPQDAAEGTLRKKYAKIKAENSVHGSDSDASAEREIELYHRVLFA